MMLQELEILEKEAREAIAAAGGLPELAQLKVRFLGKKGALTVLLRGMGKLPPEERPQVGKGRTRCAPRWKGCFRSAKKP